MLTLLGRVGVPRVGPLTEAADFVLDCFAAFEFGDIRDAAQRGHAAGATPDEVARELLGHHADWTEAHRLVVNIDTAYRDINGDRSQRAPLAMFARMARLESAAL